MFINRLRAGLALVILEQGMKGEGAVINAGLTARLSANDVLSLRIFNGGAAAGTITGDGERQTGFDIVKLA